jgi:Flp pilus assembly protein TadG
VLNFLRNPSGLAVMMAVTTPVLLGAIGLAIDFALMTRLDSEMPAAADAAALGSTKEISLAGATDSQIKAVATAALENLASSEMQTPASRISSSMR